MATNRLLSFSTKSLRSLLIRRFHGNRGVYSTGYCSSTDGDELGRQKSLLNCQDIYNSLLQVYSDGEGTVSPSRFLNDLLETGLTINDPRLKSTLKELQSFSQTSMSHEDFIEVVTPNITLIETALKGQFVIPDFGIFTQQVDRIYNDCSEVVGGKNADYISELAQVDPNLWGVSLCTIDGQRHSIGDSSTHFTVQSGSKCYTYGIAVEEYGLEKIHEHIGKEPSGQSFNSLFLNSAGMPHNPMINAGALVMCSLIKPKASITDKTNFVLEKFCEMAGEPSRSMKCDIMTCDSEMDSAHRNYALLHYMKEMNVISPDVDIEDLLKFYTRLCSVEVDCEKGAVMAATLANSGQCPITNTKVLNSGNTCHVLSLLHTCGMYDSAGEFSFTVGLPAKSGVSGVIMLVVPNMMGICLYSPPVNKSGNSIKGLHFCKRLVETFNFHIYDSRMAYSNPKWRNGEHLEHEMTAIMCAAHTGTLSTLKRYQIMGVDLDLCNYDGRTALHVAASEGQQQVVEFLLKSPQVSVNRVDRWLCTALDEALRFGHHEVAQLLEKMGGVRSQRGRGMVENN